VFRFGCQRREEDVIPRNTYLKEKRIAAYIRVSRDSSDIKRQRTSIEEWASLRGVTITRWFSDHVGSNPRGKYKKRKAFLAMRRAAENSEFDILVVDRQDRFGFKDTPEFWRFMDDFRNWGVELWGVEEGNLSSSDDGTVFRATAGAITSTKELKEKGWRSITGKIKEAKKGNWTGGYPPFGIDVVCSDASGALKWRLVWLGHHEREKIAPNGERTSYNGKHNLPGRDNSDLARYAPSERTERLQTVRDIFHWFANEKISPSQIATRLNKSKVDAVFGAGWNKQKIKQILRNPVYIGLPAVNKRSSGEHWEYVDGEVRKVEPVKGKVKTGRVREVDDWIGPSEPIFVPIVEVELFDRVQKKLREDSAAYQKKVPKKSAPRVASFWLRNLLICGGCNQPMRAWNARGKSGPYRTYFCGTYGTYGKHNPTNCGANRVKAEVFEGLVVDYLKKYQGKVIELLDSISLGGFAKVKPLEEEIRAKSQECERIRAATRRQLGQWAKQDGDTFSGVVSSLYRQQKGSQVQTKQGPIAVSPLIETEAMYVAMRGVHLPRIEESIKEMEIELERILERFLELPKDADVAKGKVLERIQQLEEEIKRQRSASENLVDRFHELVEELNLRKNLIEKVQQEIGMDSCFRQRSEAVQGVIDRIVAFFEPCEGRGPQARSKLIRIELVPKEGEDFVIYPKGISPALG
jgi:DNA invertase Pin-like site-specific DNA recombinase